MRARLVRLGVALTAILMMVAIASPAEAAGSKAGTNLIHTCGYITCSDYYSHNFTVAFDGYLDQTWPDPNETALGVCDVTGETAEQFELVEGAELIAVPCVVFEMLGHIRGIVKHAAQTAGCMRLQHPRGVKSVSIAVYADHSAICHSMDT